MMGNIQAIEVQIPHEVVQYWGWFLVFGIGLLAPGIAAMVRSVLATVATMFFFGWLLGVGLRHRDRADARKRTSWSRELGRWLRGASCQWTLTGSSALVGGLTA